MPVREGEECATLDTLIPPPEELSSARTEMLRSLDSYLSFLRQRFPEENIIYPVEKQAFDLVSDPPAMQKFIVAHLRRMWERHLAFEWERTRPMLQAAVRAFAEIDLGRFDRLEAARLVTGQEPNEKLAKKMVETSQLVFVPNPHIGPYLHPIATEKALWLVFGARLPQGATIEVPDLSRAEILVRLSALADDGRLRILRLIAEKGELRSPEIVQSLEMSQPTASRHLTQLTATGYLTERRCDGAKCYRLNPDRIEETLEAIQAFLASASARPSGLERSRGDIYQYPIRR